MFLDSFNIIARVANCACFLNLIMLILVTQYFGTIGAAMCLQGFLSDNSYVNHKLACSEALLSWK